MEWLFLSGIPAGYASAISSTWRPEIPNGTFVSIRSARKPGWVEENRNNPLRDWDDRERISSARFKKAVKQYKVTRQAILTALTANPSSDQSTRLEEIGRQCGEAFNRLEGRTPFIETEEREQLLMALDRVVAEAEAFHCQSLTWARDSLFSGLDAVRNW